jgi:vanadium chloroperoxidase
MSLPVLPPVPEDGTPRNFNMNYILFWNNVALDLNRLTHTVSGPQDGPPVSARALGILHLAIHDAYFGIFPYADHKYHRKLPDVAPYLAVKVPEGIEKADCSCEAKNAVAGAAITVLTKLYKNPNKPNANTPASSMQALGSFIDTTVRSFANTNNLDFGSRGYSFGVGVATNILNKLEIKSNEKGADAGPYVPNTGKPYFFDDEPSHPVRPRPIDPNNPSLGTKATRPYHGPFYGKSAAVFATTTDWKVADPYVIPREEIKASSGYMVSPKYLESVEDVHRMGGAEGLPTTKRTPAQTAHALFWAYDGTNLVGTPPRLYNQIIRQVAYDRAVCDQKVVGDIDSDINNAEFARLFALANVAMTDAGIFCWREKYRYELWRPLSGVRQDPSAPAPDGFARPFWHVLGAPATNSNEGGFKPPFPAYPSGHATFGAAAFQTVRRFYHAIDSPVAPTLKPTESQKSIPAKMADPANSDKYAEFHGKDDISFKFISDELNGINRELYQTYDPSHPIADQAGDVRTKLSLSFSSMKDAIFSNAISRIWLGVHWHFDAFAGEDVMVNYMESEKDGRDNNPQRPEGYKQLYKCKDDGSTMYQNVEDMGWFGTQGPREGDAQRWWFGGVPLGMLIADDIFSNGMKFLGSLKDLSSDKPAKRMPSDV